jgi:hypothetical protein
MDRDLCLICAWRGDCKKRFKSEGRVKCQDFCRDVAIKEAPRKEEAPETTPAQPKGLWNI